MIKIELERDKDNRFYIGYRQYNRMAIRIMDVYLDKRRLNRDEFYMMGPRAVHINIDVEYPHRVFASITSLKEGNKMIRFNR